MHQFDSERIIGYLRVHGFTGYPNGAWQDTSGTRVYYVEHRYVPQQQTIIWVIAQDRQLPTPIEMPNDDWAWIDQQDRIHLWPAYTDRAPDDPFGSSRRVDRQSGFLFRSDGRTGRVQVGHATMEQPLFEFQAPPEQFRPWQIIEKSGRIYLIDDRDQDEHLINYLRQRPNTWVFQREGDTYLKVAELRVNGVVEAVDPFSSMVAYSTYGYFPSLWRGYLYGLESREQRCLGLAFNWVPLFLADDFLSDRLDQSPKQTAR